MEIDKLLFLYVLRAFLAICMVLFLIVVTFKEATTLWLLVPILIFTAFRFDAMLMQIKHKNQFKGDNFSNTLSISDLKTYFKLNEVYLGSGFIWERKHTAKLLNYSEGHIDFSKPKNNPALKGAKFMQALESNRELYVPLKFLDGHTLITGTTGAGKTRLFDLLIAQAVMRKECVIILDPKGDKDLRNHTKEVAEAINSGSFLFFHPGFPKESIGLNPIYNFSRSTELASRIAQLVPTAKGGNDPFRSFSQLALNVIIGGLELIKVRPTLKNIRYYVDGRVMELCFLAFKVYFEEYTLDKNKEEMQVLLKATSKVPGRLLAMYNAFYLKTLSQSKPNTALEALYSLSRHDATHYGKMIATLMPLLDSLCAGELGELLTPNKTPDIFKTFWDFERIISHKQVVYIGLDSLTDPMVGSALGSLLLADLAAVAGSKYNYGKKIEPVNIFVDEAAEVTNDQLIQILNKGRGAGFRVTVATQTIPDFEARLGSSAKAMQVLGNMNNLISLRIIDPQTCDYIENTLPKVRVKYFSESTQNSLSSQDIFKINAAKSESTSEQEVPLIKGSNLINLPDLEFIARVGASTVYKGKLPFITSDVAN